MTNSAIKYPDYVILADSYKEPVATLSSGDIDTSENIQVTLLIKTAQTDEAVNDTAAGDETYNSALAFSECVLNKVKPFTEHFNLDILSVNESERTIILHGTIASFETALKTPLKRYTDEAGITFRGRAGYIYVPSEIADIVEGIYGLDDRPCAKPHVTMLAYNDSPAPKRSRGYLPADVGRLYNFPEAGDGTGQCIAIIALGGGYREEDLKKYFALQGIPMPDISCVCINGKQNAPTIPHSDDKEVMLDIQVAGSIAPGAKIVVYFAANNDKGFLDAINKAIHDRKNKPSVISISWGSPEKKWTRQSLKAYNEAFKKAALAGITICAATGDFGSSDGVHDGKVHVDFPSSSPYVLACGGTRLVAKNGIIKSECVWHDSDHAAGGGGISEYFPLPQYQESANVPMSLNPSRFNGRGVPDVAGNAAYSTGYRILVNGHWMMLGGTSAVAPLYAGLIARLNQIKGSPIGFINPYLYENPDFFREIVKGNNITARPQLGYTAGPGWNACTGLGVLENVMKGVNS